MIPLKSVWNKLTTDPNRPPERDQQGQVSDSLMNELDFQIKELERLERENDQEQKRKETGVDYSWLISAPPKTYEIPQLERLELEGLCYQVKPEETGKVLNLFRDALLNEPKPSQLSRILRACIRQILEQRPKEETLAAWVTKRSLSLGSLRVRPISSKVSPSPGSGNVQVDPEIQAGTPVSHPYQNNAFYGGRTISLPEYTNKYAQSQDVDSLPV
ncbi:protein RD3-like [Mizuhopecten yessoensis]|uniref:Protein RD3 n=1 Tax=Mizuhopecten yessoensis TaxID=6573 RepID=A0A210PYL3_MIZYE|nr:protein RD3-like [Mizuhopecten yessoensis]XP_021371812.1 protein RD3-like [Mizuhopecten yessoensis]OWF41563.1 Protein RD3 [Mizuhopecten yessoensis]